MAIKITTYFRSSESSSFSCDGCHRLSGDVGDIISFNGLGDYCIACLQKKLNTAELVLRTSLDVETSVPRECSNCGTGITSDDVVYCEDCHSCNATTNACDYCGDNEGSVYCETHARENWFEDSSCVSCGASGPEGCVNCIVCDQCGDNLGDGETINLHDKHVSKWLVEQGYIQSEATVPAGDDGSVAVGAFEVNW